MEEQDIDIINKETKKEQIINFINKNKKKFIAVILILIFIPIVYYSFDAYKNNEKKKISEKFTSATINFNKGKISDTVKNLDEIINKKDTTYSPLALYFLIDNDIISDNDKLNEYFDLIINKIDLDENIKDLIIYKKAIFNSNYVSPENIIEILQPILNKDSIWKSHALYLLGEFYYSEGDNVKAKRYFENIVSLNNSNEEIRLQAQIRLQRDLSD